MHISDNFDPSEASIRIQKLTRQINELLAFASNPDMDKLVELATELRHQAQMVRLWAFERQVYGRSNAY